MSSCIPVRIRQRGFSGLRCSDAIGWNDNMRNNPAMHKIAIVALHGVVPFDLATATEVFGWTRTLEQTPAYEIRVCGEAGNVDAGVFGIRTEWRLSSIAWADTVIVPGLANPFTPIAGNVTAIIRAAVDGGARVASICSGAFVLAAAGVLDGLRATTHWRAAAELARRYPAITVDPNVLYVDNGQILTSAGAAAGLDLCLHMVRRDYGPAVAADSARLAVMPPMREGGQAQFIAPDMPPCSSSLQPILNWMEKNLQQPLTLEDIARQAATSTRTLSRRFLDQTGTTPLQWLLAARIRYARRLLETTVLSVEQIATATGFGSATALRARFAQMLGTSPLRYRQTFRHLPITPIPKSTNQPNPDIS